MLDSGGTHIIIKVQVGTQLWTLMDTVAFSISEVISFVLEMHHSLRVYIFYP